MRKGATDRLKRVDEQPPLPGKNQVNGSPSRSPANLDRRKPGVKNRANRFLIRSSGCASVSQVHHSKKATWSSPLWVMRSITCLPLVLLLAISGFLPLYHALRDGELSQWVTARSVSKSHGEGWAADRGPGPREIHFCGVCAFTKGMNGALHVAYQKLPPPSQASSTLAARSQVAARWLSLHPISRAPPALLPG
jgi:hypothetical protein